MSVSILFNAKLFFIFYNIVSKTKNLIRNFIKNFGMNFFFEKKNSYDSS